MLSGCRLRSAEPLKSKMDGYDTDDNVEYFEEIYNACSLSILARVAEATPSVPSVPQATGVLQSLSNAKLLYKTMRAEWSYAFEVEL